MVPVALMIGRWWSQRSGGVYRDEFEAQAVAAIGEAAVTWDPNLGEWERWARRTVDHRCHDLRRRWWADRHGRFVYADPTERLPEVPAWDVEAPWEPGWVRARLAALSASQPLRGHGAGACRPGTGTGPGARSFAAMAAWIDGQPMKAVAAVLGVHPSRLSQMRTEVAAHLRAELEEAS